MHQAELDIVEWALRQHPWQLLWDAAVHDKVATFQYLKRRKLLDLGALVGPNMHPDTRKCLHQPIVWAAWRASSKCLGWMVGQLSASDVQLLAVTYASLFSCDQCRSNSDCPATVALSRVYDAFLRTSRDAKYALEASRIHRTIQREALRQQCAVLFRCTLSVGGGRSVVLESLMQDCATRHVTDDSGACHPDFLKWALDAAPPVAEAKDSVSRDHRWPYVVATYAAWAETPSRRALARDLIDRELWSRQRHLDLVFVLPPPRSPDNLSWLFEAGAPATVQSSHVLVLLRSSQDEAAANCLQMVLQHLSPGELESTERAVHEHLSRALHWPKPSVVMALRAARVFSAELGRVLASRFEGKLGEDQCRAEWTRWDWPDLRQVLAGRADVDLGSLSNVAHRLVWDRFLLPLGWAAVATELQGQGLVRSLPWFEERATFLVRRGFCWTGSLGVFACTDTKNRADAARCAFQQPVDMACHLWRGNRRFTRWLVSAVVRLVPCGTARANPSGMPEQARKFLRAAYLSRTSEMRLALAPSLSHVSDLVSMVVQYLE